MGSASLNAWSHSLFGECALLRPVPRTLASIDSAQLKSYQEERSVTEYRIDKSNSIDVVDKAGFTLAVGDIITVANEGSIKASGSNGDGIFAQGGNRFKIDGSVVGASTGIVIGAYSSSGTDASSSIYVGATGQVSGRYNGLTLSSGSYTVHNSGSITSEMNYAIYFNPGASTRGLTVFNTGTISGPKDIYRPYAPIVGAIHAWGATADTITNIGLIRGAILLGDGSDVYSGQSGFADGLIDLGYGDDQVYGGTGSETIKITDGSDTIDGGNGIDTIVINDTAVTIDLNRADAQNTGDLGLDVIRNIENITSGSRADSLTGNQLNNILISEGGDDTVKGGGGDDLLQGGGDHDSLSGEQGNDTLDGGYAGNEGFGNDTLNGGEGFDTAVFQGAESRDQAVFVNMANPQDARNTDGADVYISIEQLIGTKFADTFIGDASGTIFKGGAGNDTLDGGTGVDTAVYTSAATVNLAAGNAATAAEGSDTLSAIENVTGSEQADRLTGDAAANVLAGNGGNDILDGGAGADRLVGGAGDDVYYTDALDMVTEAAIWPPSPMWSM
jgi:Ca2+-binding RTX toxin-like protein